MNRVAAVFSVLAALLLSACGNPNQRLDEYLFYDGPQFKLKLVRFYRNVPFDQLGERAVVMCRSNSTADIPSQFPEDTGWRMLGSGDARGSHDAREAARGVTPAYEVLDEHTLVSMLKVFNISFDACGHFINWDPSRLPDSMIDPVEKPDTCAPTGLADCRYLDFEDARMPRYRQVRVEGPGRVSFTVSSRAFRDIAQLHVQTLDNGAVWHVDVEGAGDIRDRLNPGVLRSLPVSSLDAGLEAASLSDWLAGLLPPGGMVIWPDASVVCGARRCASIHFNDSAGNSGVLSLVVASGKDGQLAQAGFESAVYRAGETDARFSSLAGLQKALRAGAT